MTKKQRITASVSLFSVAVLTAVYGAGFSWRAVLLGGLAILIWQYGDEVWRAAFAKPAFTRIQFRFGLNFLANALQDAGIYLDELPEAAQALSDGLKGRGWIIFTWLEPELFYLDTENHFSSTLELSIDLASFGSRMPERVFQLSDMVELRSTSDGYELALVTREQRYASSGYTRDVGLILFKLPYKFFWALQGAGDPWA